MIVQSVDNFFGTLGAARTFEQQRTIQVRILRVVKVTVRLVVRAAVAINGTLHHLTVFHNLTHDAAQVFLVSDFPWFLQAHHPAGVVSLYMHHGHRVNIETQTDGLRNLEFVDVLLARHSALLLGLLLQELFYLLYVISIHLT